jgi:hypothetical protein
MSLIAICCSHGHQESRREDQRGPQTGQERAFLPDQRTVRVLVAATPLRLILSDQAL